MSKPILLDQYHIDIYAIGKLTKDEQDQINATFFEPKWLEKLLEFQFGTTLREKIQIKITQ